MGYSIYSSRKFRFALRRLMPSLATMFFRSTILLCFALCLLTACQRRGAVTKDSRPAENSHALRTLGPKTVACNLVTKDEVSAIQGAAMTEPTSSEGAQGEFYRSQCYYGSNEPNKSVSLAVIQRTSDHPGTRMVTEFWHETFASAGKSANQRGAENKTKGEPGEREREEHEGPAPQKTEGFGEEAYWIGNPMGGILYVLKNEQMLRISVGGADSAEKKLEKSKQLAQKALSRL
jgi:hypothetical protein